MNLLVFISMAQAFCGFYAGGAGSDLFNNATMVVMMRQGSRTVLSMQNNYEGPPKDFAMVVPVPVILKEEEVKTLPKDIFQKVDTMAAPRLVEYWEVDPCRQYDGVLDFSAGSAPPSVAMRRKGGPPLERKVIIEAQFQVAEYDIVILSAKEAGALDKWLRKNNYNIPAGSKELYKPYIASGQYFFVAKVNTKKFSMNNGQATLSPLRFHYDSDTFELPIRLGLINAKDSQDLIVHILAQDRYEVANMNNVTIPTNIQLTKESKSQFSSFYSELFDQTMAQNPKSVVTEYAWAANTCDPCPAPSLNMTDFKTLGGDVVPLNNRGQQLVLTRLHTRYTKETLGDDLIFKKASPIAGGREVIKDSSKRGELEEGAVSSSYNNFQGRYIIRYPWEGPVSCSDPRYGIWGGPNGGSPQTNVALETAFAPKSTLPLEDLIAEDIPELNIKAKSKK